MNETCYEKACMADREWPSINPGERVCCQCPRYVGNAKAKVDAELEAYRETQAKKWEKRYVGEDGSPVHGRVREGSGEGEQEHLPTKDSF